MTKDDGNSNQKEMAELGEDRGDLPEKGQGESAVPAEDGRPEYEELFDRHLRLQAEFDNYRKRVEKEKSDFRAYAYEKLIADLLPVLDHLELALKHSREMDADPTLLEGVELVIRQFNEVMAKYGVEAVEALGNTFDPNYHEALSQIESEKHEDNQVVEEFQKGYLLSGRMIRPSKVTVSRKPKNDGESP
jgi:molecular chaperone GrpE